MAASSPLDVVPARACRGVAVAGGRGGVPHEVRKTLAKSLTGGDIPRHDVPKPSFSPPAP
jgi:hypothetical protein